MTAQISNFIGAGERTCGAILNRIFNMNLSSGATYNHKLSGIFTQVPLPALISPGARENLAELHVKSSVDFVLHDRTPDGMKRYAIYVNGDDHNGDLKGRRDAARYGMLASNGYTIVVLRKPECPALFDESFGIDAFREVISAIDNPYNLL